jgi:hypothetical protein
MDDLPMFTHGKKISFMNCNGFDYQYIIDHCVYEDEYYAYLKVICFDSCQFHYDTWSTRPPLILAVPLTHSDVRMHPNLIPDIPLSLSPINPIINPGIGKEALRKFKANRSEAWWKRLWRPAR